MKNNSFKIALIITIIFSFASKESNSQTVNPSMFDCMKWRMIGPYRGGRTVGASGDLKHPNIFYIGVNNGGVWKTNDYGRTWKPIFDDQPTGSIGDVAVAPSNPDVIYVGSGEGLHRPDLSTGDGMYKSIDAGKTWTHIGLQEGLQIGGIAIDPKNENIVFVAVLGHPYGPNKERGVYRTTDGGNNWTKVLYSDENTGAIQVTIDPKNSKVIYADMWAGRLAPWENGEWKGPGSGFFKSSDGGNTWKQIFAGLPTPKEGLDRIGFCIAPSNTNRLYAVVSADEKWGGIYRSDDAGETWNKINSDIRLWDRGDDFAEMKVDPKNADIVYDANVVTWKSMDGGKTFNAFKGAPGGDDYHRLWINPENPDVILLASDQGAGITVNGGETWSSWYNQPTAQLYHVSADNDFPYNVYSGQQESGSVGIASRGDDGAITFRDWHPVDAEEYGYVVADPLNPNIVYGGKITRYDKQTAQAINISPNVDGSKHYRFIRTAPIVFSPVDNKTLYFAGNVLFKTRNGGNSWDVVSPDLTRTTYDVAECIGIYKNDSMKNMPQRGVIYTIALSPLDSNIIWVGTDDGWMHVTKDGGKNWNNITPPSLTSWSKVSMIEASHTDVNTAYAAINRIRLDDLKPHILRTKDGGKTWKEIVNGLPNDPINTVKEDPIRKGLLFAGSERAVYVSFDDGENWQSLRLNMPATSIRDLVIKDNDIAVATHGRSFWILDDITALRQQSSSLEKEKAILYKPAPAYRVRWNLNTDTPLPPDEPAGKNPPDGAILDYYLKEDVKSEITLDIIDDKTNLIRHYSSKDTVQKLPPVNIPLYWVRPQQVLSAKAGSHRFLWDMHYTPLPAAPSFPISAIYEDTAPDATSPWVLPEIYTIVLKVDGKEYSEKLEVKADPRVKATTQDYKLQQNLSLICYHYYGKCLDYMKQINLFSNNIKATKLKADKSTGVKLDELNKEVISYLTPSPKDNNLNIPSILETFQGELSVLQQADAAPTKQCMEGVDNSVKKITTLKNKWMVVTQLKIEDVNRELLKQNLPLLAIHLD